MTACSCKHCICVFFFAAILNTCMLCILLAMYFMFGSMPPSFTMAIGFWLLLFTNYFGVFVAMVIVSTFMRQEDIHFVNRLGSIGFAATSFFFFVGAILMVSPISSLEMMRYSKTYYNYYGNIPPFLISIQAKFDCCGIYNYTDYSKELMGTDYGKEGFFVYREADPNDDFFHKLGADFSHNRTVRRHTLGFDVPQSCCAAAKVNSEGDADCGKKVEFTGAAPGSDLFLKQEASAISKVNNPRLGCHKKYQDILSRGTQFQLTFLLFSIQFGSFIQGFVFLALVWVHKVALKSIRQVAYWLPELIELHKDVELAREHANIEAEADAAHDEKEIKVRKTASSNERLKNLLKGEGEEGNKKTTTAKKKKKDGKDDDKGDDELKRTISLHHHQTLPTTSKPAAGAPPLPPPPLKDETKEQQKKP